MNQPWLQRYEQGVPQQFSPSDLTLPQLLEDAARRFPKRTALDFLGHKQSYAQLLSNVRHFAAGLQELGVRKGDRVAIMLPNCPQFVVSFFGTVLAGAVVVNTSPLYVASELEHQLIDSGAEVLVILDSFFPRYQEIRHHPDLKVKHVIVTGIQDGLPFPKNLLYPIDEWRKGHKWAVKSGGQVKQLGELLSLAKQPTPVAMQPDDLALLQYTGGTTGVPKGAMLSHRNLVANCQQAASWLPELRPGEEITLAAIPFFHVYGMTVSMNLSILIGASMILVPDARNIKMLLETAQRTKATLFPGVPTLYNAINNSAETPHYNLHSIRACISGSAPLPFETAKRFRELTGGANLVEGYGLTETSPITHVNPIHGGQKDGSIGMPLPGVLASVCDEAGHEVPLGEVGELWVSGPNVMLGYWQRPDETAKTIREEGGVRWLLTGDMATMDEDGFFRIVDRKKELIIAGGFNIYPREVEEVLYQHPAILEAAVIGVPDAYRGESVKAFVVFKPGHSAAPEEIIAFCRKLLSPYKAPRSVEVRETLPKSAVGKVLRRVLAEEEKQKRTNVALG